MKVKIFISFVLIYSFLFNEVFAWILFSELLPNTINDKDLEYIELYNSWSTEHSLSWYILKDKAEKEFIFWSWNILWAFKFKKYYRKDTSILLNNIWEDLFLYNNSWSLIDSFSYTWSEKWIVIKIINFNTWTKIYSWEILVETGVVENTWAVIFSSWNVLVDSWSIILLENTWTIVFSWWVENNSWEILTETWIESFSWIIENNSWSFLKEKNNEFNLKFSFQNPSYILEKEKKLKKYTCDNSKDICKINIDLRNSFTGAFKEKDYTCDIDFWFKGWKSWEENKCNPWTIVFPKWDYDLKFKIIQETNTWNIFTWWFVLENKIEPKIIEIIKEIQIEKIVEKNICSDNWWKVIKNKIKITKPEIIIQSWLDKNNNCKKEECSINLIYEEKNKLEKCEWIFEWWKFKTGTDKKCNPWYVKYKKWYHKIILKVYEKDNKDNYEKSILDFTNIKKTKINLDQNIVLNEKLIQSNSWFVNNNILRYIKLWNININPKWKDDSEYVEIVNYSSWKINLSWCYLDDVLIKWSKKHVFKNDFILEKNEIKKLYKKDTKIILNNSFDEVNLVCDWNIIDKIKRNFIIKEWYILNNEKLIIRDKIKEINNILQAKKDIKKQNEILFKNNLNVFSWESKIISNEASVKTTFQPIIEIQWKIWENKKLENNKITCYDTCSINFDWSKSVWNIEKYIWDFWNWEKYEWKNPWYIKYKKYWKYKVTLNVKTKFQEEKQSQFLVEFFKKIKTKSIKKKTSKIKSSNISNKKYIAKNTEEKNIKIENKKMTKIEIILYVLIFIFSLNLVVIILKREKLL